MIAASSEGAANPRPTADGNRILRGSAAEAYSVMRWRIMAITDRTRKLLWARSGNRCAICKSFLVVEGESEGETALLGEECHIVAQSPLGPRGNGERPDDIDGCYNLILLCATHHKLVDELPEVYTAERLRSTKKAHEGWLASIGSPRQLPQVRIRPASNEHATWLARAGSARELIDSVYQCCAGDYGHDALGSHGEVEIVGSFLQEVEDLDIYASLEIRERVRTEFRLDELLEKVEEAGFVVYAGRMQRTLEIDGADQPWPVAVVRVLRANNPAIQAIDKTHNTAAPADQKAPLSGR